MGGIISLGLFCNFCNFFSFLWLPWSLTWNHVNTLLSETEVVGCPHFILRFISLWFLFCPLALAVQWDFCLQKFTDIYVRVSLVFTHTAKLQGTHGKHLNNSPTFFALLLTQQHDRHTKFAAHRATSQEAIIHFSFCGLFNLFKCFSLNSLSIWLWKKKHQHKYYTLHKMALYSSLSSLISPQIMWLPCSFRTYF